MRSKWKNKNRKFFAALSKFIPLKYLEESMYHPSISVHKSTYVHWNAVLRQVEKGSLTIGKGCTLRSGAMLITQMGDIHIGNKVSINPYCVLYGTGGLVIEDNVRLAAHTVIIPANHVF